ncbi:nitroreductase/quinone reductase family protein [Nocardia crassostreae]|uniref:nitroreductase/quinone reductase family protein n=1 Tax=Nocardia crassostreae TaxID=53428 RepID=UPI000B2BD040|nr:nitroreductase/quinone reductase family protein [Nocardia crassostreae]
MKTTRRGKRTPMTLRVRPVDTTGRPSRFVRVCAAISARVPGFVSRHIAWKLDPLLLRLTRGRLATTSIFPTGLLETEGARTRVQRHNAIIYIADGDDVVIAASNAGSATNPGWYYNLLANPDVVFGGAPMRATVVDNETERQRLWAIADRVFPAYISYRREAGRAGRTIPLVRLTRRAAG